MELCDVGLSDYVVLCTMLLFSRVDVTLHAGGGTRRVVQRIWADSGSTAIQRGDWLVGGANIDVSYSVVLFA